MNTEIDRRRVLGKLPGIVCALAAVVVIGGCRSARPKPPKPVPVVIEIVPRGKTAEYGTFVYIGPATADAELRRRHLKPYDDSWLKDPVDQIMTEAAKGREQLDCEAFSLRSGEARTIELKDLVWREWLPRGADHVVVIGDIPPPASGGKDPRRVSIPLDKRFWKERKRAPYRIEVSEKEVKLTN